MSLSAEKGVHTYCGVNYPTVDRAAAACQSTTGILMDMLTENTYMRKADILHPQMEQSPLEAFEHADSSLAAVKRRIVADIQPTQPWQHWEGVAFDSDQVVVG